jgi:hypothetical protein
MKNKTIIIVSIIGFSLIISTIFLSSFIKKAQNCKGLCAGCNGCSNKKENQKIMYYVDKKNELTKNMKQKQKLFIPSLEEYYSRQQIDQILIETANVFDSLLVDIPYIGGDDNSMTEDIEQASMVLAFYKIQKKYGRTTKEIGTIINQSIKREIDKYPKWIRHIIGGKFFTKKHIQSLQNNILVTQKREYEYNWVTYYIESSDQTFDYGYNHTECGIVKYLTKNEAEDLIPYLCSLDFLYSDAFDEGLTRTSTIAENGTICDFRFKRKK